MILRNTTRALTTSNGMKRDISFRTVVIDLTQRAPLSEGTCLHIGDVQCGKVNYEKELPLHINTTKTKGALAGAKRQASTDH